MNRRNVLKTLAGLALCPVCAPRGFAADAAHHWGYDGDVGPAKWGDLENANKVCSVGAQQSPIDIGATVKSQLSPLQLNWGSADTIVNNGHTIQLNFAEGSTLKLDDTTYNLLQLHFHRPSEHLIGGKSFPMEAHFVHRSQSGALAVVGVLMTTGTTNPAFHKIVSTMPEGEGPAVKADPGIDAKAMLPAKLSYYRYQGSLTTPPCAEIVEWLLLTDPIEVAEADIASFARLYQMNARPAQKDNRRYVLQSN